jgi:hypothetical protein
MQIKIKYFLPIWWVNSFWFEDADIIDQLAILDLTGTDLIECMYGYTEMEALATYFDMNSESLLIQWQEFIQILSSDNRSLKGNFAKKIFFYMFFLMYKYGCLYVY